MNKNTLDIEKIIGHMGEVAFTVKGYFGKQHIKKEGRVIYSKHQSALFFLPKGNRSNGYEIADLISFELIRRDNKNHKKYKELYQNRKQLEEEVRLKRQEQADLYREQEERKRNQYRQELATKKHEEQKMIEEYRKLTGYEKLEKEIHDFYTSNSKDFYNEHMVETIVIPLIYNLKNKAIENIDNHPKNRFDKKSNPNLCILIENTIKTKLKNTQKANVNIINSYLKK